MRTAFNLRRSRAWFVLLLGLLVTLVLPLGASADPAQKAVYTATNDPAGNSLLVFATNKDGSLTLRETVPTGGTGSPAQPPFSFPIVDSSGSLNVTQDGHLVFVVNDGDNTISSFRVEPSGLRLVSHVSSGGLLPVSLTTRGDLLYTVNEESSNIYGFRFRPGGELQPLGGQALSSQFPNTVAAQISFTPDGRQLIVTERGLPKSTGVIDVFDVGPNGVAGPAHPNTGVGVVDPNPFGFDFDNHGHLLVSNAGQVNAPGDGPPPIPQVFDPTEFGGTASSYDVSRSGTLTHTSDVASGGRAACWLVVSKDGKYAFVTNTLSDTVADIFSGIGGVTSYAVAKDGTLTYLSQVSTSPGNPGDEAVSQDGKYLYVLVPTVFGPPGSSHIETYRINKDGSLTQVASAGGLPPTISGLGTN
jgi:6-phosphogluconolactonase